MNRKCSFLPIFLGLFVSTICDASEPLTHFGFEAAKLSAVSKEGMEAIFSGHCFHNGVPLAAVRMMSQAMARQKDLGYNPSDPGDRFYAFGRLPSPTDRPVGFDTDTPLGESVFERGGVKLMNGNCFACHAGVVNGVVVAGLGNSHFNMSGRLGDARGDNYGPYGVWHFVSRLVDPANQGLVVSSQQTELEKYFESIPRPTVDPMPWWLMKYKTRDYWYADAAPDDATHFAINFTTPHAQMNENHAEHVALVAKALAFARETQPPPFPGKIDADLVQRGADLFHGRTPPADKTGFVSCKTCHGTYSKRDGHADLSQPGHWAVDYPHSEVLRNVKTDSAYNDALQKFAPLVEHMQKLETYYASAGTPELTPKVRAVVKAGYVAPPLVGVWATAPYFHNGSVPTVEAVLHSPSRPTIWAREHRDPHAYDLEKVGMRFRVLTLEESQAAWNEASQKPDRSRPRIDLAAIYDTTAFGRANTGHTFGDHLTADERSAVIEFLKSLSGNGM